MFLLCFKLFQPPWSRTGRRFRKFRYSIDQLRVLKPKSLEGRQGGRESRKTVLLKLLLAVVNSTIHSKYWEMNEPAIHNHQLQTSLCPLHSEREFDKLHLKEGSVFLVMDGFKQTPEGRHHLGLNVYTSTTLCCRVQLCEEFFFWCSHTSLTAAYQTQDRIYS